MMTWDLVANLTAMSIPQNADPSEMLRYFSWLGFGGFGLIYSAFVFSGELSKDGPLFFSKRNARSTQNVLACHSLFLTILFCLLRLANHLVLILPYWLTDTYNAGRSGPVSIVDCVFAAIVALMAYLERKWLYVESDS